MLFLPADDLCAALSRIGCDLRTRDQGKNSIPTYSVHEQMPLLLDEIALKYSDMIISWVRDGVKLLDSPVGTDSIVSTQMEQIQQSNLNELSILAQIDDGPIHFQFLLLYVLHTCITTCVLPHMIAPFLMLWLSTNQHGVRLRSMLVWRMDLKMLLNVLMRMLTFVFRLCTGGGIRGSC